MGSIATAFPTSLKAELAQGLHCFNGPATPTGTTTNANSHLTALSSLAGLGRGMSVTGSGIPANSYLGFIDSANSAYITQQASAGASGVTLTFSGDDFKMALAKASPTGTYDATTTNYSNLTGNSDEASGTGYSAGGYDFTAAQNITPATSGTTAFWSWGVNPSWAGATLSVSGCIIYNASEGNRAVYVGSFGGTQTVTSGTLTVLLPTNNNTNAILRIQ